MTEKDKAMRERDREPAFRPSIKTSSWSHQASLLLLHILHKTSVFSSFSQPSIKVPSTSSKKANKKPI